MPDPKGVILAVKCAPQKAILTDIKRAVELYLSEQFLNNSKEIIFLCRKFPFRYAVHAPNNGHRLDRLLEVVTGVSAEIVVFHNIYWEDEWEDILESFNNINTKLCIENTWSVHEP